MFQSKPANGKEQEATASKGQNSAPAITLPKGGGAIRGMGEKFAANPVTGTGFMSVPIFTSPGRSGFGPQLSLSYDSGAGNGPFGFGWSLSLPSITRKTDKGLPQYRDAEESDVFLLSGAEDLVPVFKRKTNDEWDLDADGHHVIGEESQSGYCIRRYRPRIEGLFARIERWTRETDGDVHWRSISKDNILTLYGENDNSRIADPEDSGRVFSWLICETRDDKGNGIIYEYKSEDGAGVDLTKAYEHNRGDQDDRRRKANRYLKRILYGNRVTLLDDTGKRPRRLTDAQILNAGWMFEAVFDYGEHDNAEPQPSDDPAVSNSIPWPVRYDSISTYRAGFEVRTCRLCQRVLMFHHIPDLPTGEKGYDGLVRSTDFAYSYEKDATNARNPIYSFLLSVTQIGYKPTEAGRYFARSIPPIEFEYSQPIVQDTVQDLDAESLENLPVGLDGGTYQWTDLHGEGIPGILTEQAGAWYYKRNLSPIGKHPVEFAPLEQVAAKPNLSLAGGHAQFMDLAGDGQPDLVVMDGPITGLYEHDSDEGWQPFRPFTSRLNRDARNPNMKFVDLDGDGHADVLITEDDAFVWHPSLAEEGFGPARRVHQAYDEEKGPRLVFADGTQSIYLADLSGDGLTDLARIRNGEVCYWPNLGYGRFGAKVTMDNAPWFDSADHFDQKRIRLADIDGSGTTDIIYLHGNGVHLYFNQSGNSWSAPQPLRAFPQTDEISAITPIDLKGNGTACLVWSSPLTGQSARQMRYVDLMGGQKPNLLLKSINNLGAETQVTYAPSTKFYLADKRDGRPWITRLPFPVHVVERVETYDHISRNRFVTRYTYHHGYFDGEEREFRGFGMVEQKDTEEFAALSRSDAFPIGDNNDAASHVPPVLTKTWFHTGVYLGRERVSNYFAGLLDERDVGEYFPQHRTGDATADAAARALLLDDTVLPGGLSIGEEREACRALKGSMLRQEVYGLDGTDKETHPYIVTEQNFTIELAQPRGDNRHAVFFSHPREALSYHYERNPEDPRISHALTLEVENKYGNVLKSLSIAYGRKKGQSPLQGADKEKQEQILITYAESDITNPIDKLPVDPEYDPDNYRAPLPCEVRTNELTGLTPENGARRFSFDELTRNNFENIRTLTEVPYEQAVVYSTKCKRLIERIRTLYRKNDLSGFLGRGELEYLALPGETYKLAFTSGLIGHVFERDGQALVPVSGSLLRIDAAAGNAADRGGYVELVDGDGKWWIPSGRVYYSSDTSHDSSQEFDYTRQHFFLPRRYRDPFHIDTIRETETFVDYDAFDLLVLETRDALDNRVTAGERDAIPSRPLKKQGNEYRVLQPRIVMDPNRNRIEVMFDALGLVVGTAVMGKPEDNPAKGDRIGAGFTSDLTDAEISTFFEANDPRTPAVDLLKDATTRIVYDLHRFRNTRLAHPHEKGKWEPTFSATLARESHVSDPMPLSGLKIQIGFSYSDGFGREIQKKIQAEPGPMVEGGTVISPRWVGSGWSIFNNKGKPVRQYEPFFSQLQEKRHSFEYGVAVGVSPILFYDPVERVVATQHPNHTYEKVVFDPWLQTSYDVNDTTKAPDKLGDPPFDSKNDPDVGHYFKRLPDNEYLPTWYDLRTDATKALQEWPDTDAQGQPIPYNAKRRAAEKDAAIKASSHANTPTTAHFDTLGRPFLTIAHYKVVCPGHALDGSEDKFATRIELDIEGNQRAVLDERRKKDNSLEQRVVMRYEYDMLGNRIHQVSMEAGERWMLNDVTGMPIRAWNNRGFTLRMTYDVLRRPTGLFVTEKDIERLAEQTIYGETQGIAANHNTRIYQVRDGAGIVTRVAYDYKGNLLEGRRDLLAEYQSAPDWLKNPVANDGSFTSRTTLDALNRPITSTSPDGSIYYPTFNEANLLDKVAVKLRGAGTATEFVRNINYNAKGQRELIEYGSGAGPNRQGVTTSYEYDKTTFRLAHLETIRPVGSNGHAKQIFTDPIAVQDLYYAYDPKGNITRIADIALKTIFNNNEQVDPVCSYTYDAAYRLVEAKGREHIGQTAYEFNQASGSRRDYPFAGLDDFIANPNDVQKLRNFIERYEYDSVGNFDKIRHLAANGSWTRTYECLEDSMIEAGKKSNRLTKTTVGNGLNNAETYTYNDAQGNDVNGCMTAINNMKMVWDFKDQLRQVDKGSGDKAYYVYDAGGQRVRKVIETQNGTRQKERIYLGSFEIYREYKGNETTKNLERETLHIMDDKQRIALVETKTYEAGLLSSISSLFISPTPVIRYQFGNHLGSASVELAEDSALIAYEECHPYGTTSFLAGRSAVEVSLKRYRYTGKERDDESGLYYHGARYCAVWLARWTSCDPIGALDGLNLYVAFGLNPVCLVDRAGTQALPGNQQAPASNVPPYDGPTISAAPPYYGPGLPYKPTLNPPHPEDALGDLVATILPFVPGGVILAPLLGNLRIEHQLEHHEISPDDAELARLQLALGVRLPLPGGAPPTKTPATGTPANVPNPPQPPSQPALAQTAKATPPPAPTASPAQPQVQAPAPAPPPPANAGQGGQPAPFRVGNAGETMAKFSMRNSAVSGPNTLLDQKATLKDATGKTALPDPNSTKGARIPDVPMKGESNAVGTVEVKTPFGSPPVDPAAYLRTHPQAVNQLQREGRIVSQGGTTWGPAGGPQWPVQPGEGIGLTTGYWVWWPTTMWH